MKKLIEVEFTEAQDSPAFGSREIGDKIFIDSEIAKDLESKKLVKILNVPKKKEMKEDGS